MSIIQYKTTQFLIPGQSNKYSIFESKFTALQYAKNRIGVYGIFNTANINYD